MASQMLAAELQTLTREEKEKLVEQRIERMKERNERLRQRQKEIEEEQRAMGEAASPPSAVTETAGWREPDQETSHEEGRAPEWPGDQPPGMSTHSDRNEERRSRGGRGGARDYQKQHNTPQGPQSKQAADVSSPTEDWHAEATATPPSRGRGRGARAGSGRLSGIGGSDRGGGIDRGAHHGRGGERGGRGGDSYLSYDDRRKQNYAAYEEEIKSHGRGQAANFLADGFRDRPRDTEVTNEENRGRGGGHANRHPRNYGGGDENVDLRQKIKTHRQSLKGGEEFNPEVNMTGKERHERFKWKEERDLCDQKRVDRSKKGDQWARPWDREKGAPNQQEHPAEYNIYKESENKRLTKRVGSGRFAVDPESRRQTKVHTGAGESPAMRGVGKGNSQSKPRSGGRGRASRRKSLQGENLESPRRVAENESNLHVTVNNSYPEHTAPAQTSPSHTQQGPISPNKSYNRQGSNRSTHPSHRREYDHRLQDSNANQHESLGRENYRGRGGGRGGRRDGGRERGGKRDEGQVERGGGGQRGGGRGGTRHAGDDRVSNKNQPIKSGNISTPVQSRSQPSTTKSHTVQNKDSPTNQPAVCKQEAVFNTSSGSEEQEIIITCEEDEDGWDDIDTDEEFYAEEEETPHVSKEPTPARSNDVVSKESTPVPHLSAHTAGQASNSTPAADHTPTDSMNDSNSVESAQSAAPAGSTPADSTPADSTPADSTPADSTPAASNPADSTPADSTPAGSALAESTPADSSVCAKVTDKRECPVKAGLHIDIRDPVNDAEEADDFLKTPEGGRERIDWAAEMEAERYCNIAMGELDATGRDPLVFYLFDVDGTLTEVRKTISREMLEFMQEIRKKVYSGIVSGSDLENVNQQLRGNAVDKFDYVFSENGLCYHRNGKLTQKTNICSYLGEEKLQEVLDFCLKYLSELKLPIKRGQFIELRSGLINICPMGRNCSNEEREVFISYDKEHHIRENFISELSQKFNDVGLVYSRGGQISFDIYPRGWNKRYCLDHIDADGFEDIHFFGDRCEPGGTDYDIYKDPRVTGHKVTGPDDLKKKLQELIMKD